MTKSPIIEIDISQLSPDPSQPRKVFDEEAIQSLREDIEANGLKEPIDINPLLDGRKTKYLIIDGECRFHAIEGIDDFGMVPCNLHTYKSQRQIDKHRASKHFHRKDWNPADRAVWLKYYIEAHKLRQQDLAREFSIKQSVVSEWLAPTRDAGVLKALRNAEIGFKQAVLLSRVDDAESRENALRDATGKTKRETEEIIARAIIEPEIDEIQVKEEALPEEDRSASQLPDPSGKSSSETVEGGGPPDTSPSTPEIMQRAFEGMPEREAEPEEEKPDDSKSEDEPPLETEKPKVEEKKKEPQVCAQAGQVEEMLQKFVNIPPKTFLARFKTASHKGNFKNRVEGIHLWSGELSDLMESNLNSDSLFICEVKRKRKALMEILKRPKHDIIDSQKATFNDLMNELKAKIEQDAKRG